MWGKRNAATEPLTYDGYRVSSIITCGTCGNYYSTEKYASCPCCADWNGQPVPNPDNPR